MSTDLTQAWMVIGLIAAACAILSPLLVWLLSYQPETP